MNTQKVSATEGGLQDVVLITPEEVAKIFKVKQSTVYKWVKHNKIPHIRISGTVRFSQNAIMNILSSSYA